MQQTKTFELSFRVNSVPVPQPRQRHSATVVGDKVMSRNYIPKGHAINAFKAAVSEAASLNHEGDPLLGPFHLGLAFILPRPKYITAKMKTKDRVPCFTRKGDIDNFLKGVQDALNGIVYKDDCQVYSVFAQKWYAEEAEHPHTLILVQELWTGKVREEDDEQEDPSQPREADP